MKTLNFYGCGRMCVFKCGGYENVSQPAVIGESAKSGAGKNCWQRYGKKVGVILNLPNVILGGLCFEDAGVRGKELWCQNIN